MRRPIRILPRPGGRDESMRKLVYLLIVALAVLHHDVYWWHSHKPLLFGFVPVGLAHHVGISLGAGLVGLLAVKFCWPDGVDVDDADPTAPPSGKEAR